jgi:hypothetical protein
MIREFQLYGSLRRGLSVGAGFSVGVGEGVGFSVGVGSGPAQLTRIILTSKTIATVNISSLFILFLLLNLMSSLVFTFPCIHISIPSFSVLIY